MYVVFKNGGKQYKAEEGSVLLLDRLNAEPKSTVIFSEVMAIVSPTDSKIGMPYINGASVQAEVMNHGRGRKVVIFKKRRRKDSKTKRGFRRDFTRVRILKIEQ